MAKRAKKFSGKKRSPGGRFTSRGTTNIGMRIEMIHPDGKSAKLPQGFHARARSAVAQALVRLLLPQIPEDTRQLKESYLRVSNLGHIGPGGESRRDGRLANKTLAEILSRKGYLHLVLNVGMRKVAIEVVKRELNRGSGPVKWKAKVHLR